MRVSLRILAKDEGDNRPDSAGENNPLSLSQFRIDIQSGYGRGVDIEKCGGKSRKEHNDHRWHEKPESDHQFQHHGFGRG